MSRENITRFLVVKLLYNYKCRMSLCPSGLGGSALFWPLINIELRFLLISDVSNIYKESIYSINILFLGLSVRLKKGRNVKNMKMLFSPPLIKIDD